MKLNLRKKNKGFTLVEILLVVGFIALASIGIYAVYNKAITTGKANQENTNLQTIRAGINNLFGNQKDYADVSEDVVRNARISPPSMHTGAYALTNLFGGRVIIREETIGVKKGFSIESQRVPTDVCIKLGAMAGASFERIQIASAIVKEPGYKPDPEKIVVQCSEDDMSYVNMKFYSY